MSYCRFSEGDVYMYWNIYGGIECCGCKLRTDYISPRFYSRTEAIKHLELHIANNHIVPDRAIKRLKEEIKEIGDKEGLEVKNPKEVKPVINIETGETLTIEELINKMEE